MELYNSGECIEAEAASAFGKKFVPNGMIKHEIGLLRKYTFERDGSASIDKELNPKKAIYNPKSRLDQGDRLKCNKFYVLSLASSLKVKPMTFSGRHNTNGAQTSGFTYAEIVLPFSHIVNAQLKRLQEGSAQVKKPGEK